jgi:hypothetical protein
MNSTFVVGCNTARHQGERYARQHSENVARQSRPALRGCTTGTVLRKSFRNLLLFADTHHTRLGTCPPPLRSLTITAAHAHGSSALLLLLFDLRTVGKVAAS